MFIIGSFINILFGSWYKNFQFFSALFLPVAAISLYFYTKILSKDKHLAFFSSALLIFFPLIWEQSRYFMLDLPLTAFIILSLYFLKKSETFQRKKASLLFFLFASLAQLIKWYAFIYFLIPLITPLKKVLKTSKNKKQAFNKIRPYLLIPAALVLPWYVTNFKTIFQKAMFFTQPHFGNPASIFTLKNLSYYPILLLNYQIVSLQFIWLIISFIILVKSKTGFKKLLICQILFIYAVFTFLGNKNVRFLMPLLPFLAIVMGNGLNLVKKRSQALSLIIFTLLFIFSFGLFSINSFGFPVSLNLLLEKQILPKTDYIFFLDLSSKVVPYKYQQTNWSSEIIVKDLAALETNSEIVKIVVVSNNPTVSVAGINIFSLPKNYNLKFFDVPFDAISKLNTKETIDEYLKDYYYFLIPNKVVAPDWQMNFKNMESIRQHVLGGQTRDFALLKTYKLPNNDLLYLLKKDLDYNKLLVNITDDNLILKRKSAVTRIYMQFMNENDSWTQEYITEEQTEYKKDLTSIKIIRIDYPPVLWEIKTPDNWFYDGDKQLDKKITSSNHKKLYGFRTLDNTLI